MSDPRCQAEINLTQICKNLRSLSKFVGDAATIPMVKANAYGHGIIEVSKALCDEKSLYALGVATIGEGLALRASGITSEDSSIIVFSEATALNEERIQLLDQFQLTPVISSLEDLRFLLSRQEKIPYHLKFNTGMNRLGIAMSDLGITTKLITESGMIPEGVMTHLATSENPKHPLSKKQKENWITIRNTFKNISPHILTHFANSGAIAEKKFWNTETLTDIIRPGISLYGISAKPGATPRGLDLKPALRLQAQVLNSRLLKPKDSVGYGTTYQAKTSHPMAVIGLGYADGIHRILSRNSFGGLEILGTISMDMIAVRTSRVLKPGSMIEVLGPKSNWWKEAQKASTIPYEILTSLSDRVKRVYE